MNENEIERLAAMGNSLRPDWPLASLKTLLTKHELARRPRRDVAVALAWVACESATKTPARILEAGPWWLAANAEGNKVRTSYDIPCPDHAGEILPCGRCASARVPGEVSTDLARARAELQSLRSRLCSHGIDRTRGRCADCERPPTTHQPEPRATEADEESADA